MSAQWATLETKHGVTENGRNMTTVINRMAAEMPAKEKEEFLEWCYNWYMKEVIFVAPEIMNPMWAVLYHKLQTFAPADGWGKEVWSIFAAKK